MKESKIKKKKTFLKKLFLKLSRRLGYEVMDQSDLTLQDSDGENSKSSLSKLGVNSLTLPMGKVNITRPGLKSAKESLKGRKVNIGGRSEGGLMNKKGKKK